MINYQYLNDENISCRKALKEHSINNSLDINLKLYLIHNYKLFFIIFYNKFVNLYKNKCKKIKLEIKNFKNSVLTRKKLVSLFNFTL